MEEKNISKYTEIFRLRTNDFSCFDKITPQCVLDLFQDVAGSHARLIGVGYHDFIKRKLIWVLVRTKFIVEKDVDLYAKVNVTTWPKKKGKIDFDREYLIEDENGEVLIKGISKWVVVNGTTRRISLTRDIEYGCEIPDDDLFPGPFNKLEDFSIEGIEPYQEITTFSDLDHNGHVNNTSYARIILNAINLKKEDFIGEFEINHINELPARKMILNYVKRGDKIILVKGVVDNQICYIAKILLK